jgi:hypothetical protein
MSCTLSLANGMFTHGYKTVQGTRINFPPYKSSHFCSGSNCTEIVSSPVCRSYLLKYSTTQRMGKELHTTGIVQSKAYLVFGRKLDCATLHHGGKHNFSCSVLDSRWNEQLLHKSNELIGTGFHIQEQCFKHTCSGRNPQLTY